MLRTLFRFDEIDGVAPSDELGGVDDLTVPSGLVEPGAVDGVLGRARDFESGVNAYQGADAVTGATLHTRDVSVQVVMQWLNSDQGATPGTIVCRGLDGSAAERYAYGLELREVAAGVGEIRWYWQTVAGVLKTQVGGHFRAPAAGFIMLTATRRWVSPTEVELRYYCGAELLAEVLSIDGDVGGGTTGHLSIGAQRVAGAPPVWSGFLWGLIDELAIFDHALCQEEIEATWVRITEHQPNATEMVQAYAPPGAPLSTEPTSRVQRLLRVIGEVLGFALAKGEAVREYSLPDRAFGAQLERWEAITRQTSRPRTALELRRRRVISHLRSRGIDAATVREALRELLNLHPSQIELLNFANDQTDDFATLREERWSVRPGPAATVAAVSNQLVITIPAGSDTRWLGGTIRYAPRVRIAVENALDAYHGAKMTTTWSTDAEAGLLLEHGSRGDRLFFGVRNTVGVFEVVLQRWRGNVAVDATPVVIATTTSGPHWLRIRVDPAPGLLGPGETELQLEWSTDGVTFDVEDSVVWIIDHQWAGFYARTTDASNFATITARFDEWLLRTPRGTRPFRWYALRPPAIAGSPDLAGANALLRRMRHAFTATAAITTTSLLCDTETSGCDLGPMGGF